MREYKQHCSSIAKIITEPRSKADKENGILSQGGKTFIETKMKERVYKRKNEFTSKYTDKGNDMELEAIKMINEALGYFDLEKNDEFLSNDFIRGTPDIITEDEVIDIKCPWDCFTFPRFDKEIPNKDYYWQLQGYMWLTGKETAKLIYCLMDTPLHLIEREASYAVRNNPKLEYSSVLDELFSIMRYGDIELSDKIKVFEIKRDNEAIDKIKEKVLNARKYINTLL